MYNVYVYAEECIECGRTLRCEDVRRERYVCVGVLFSLSLSLSMNCDSLLQ
jgi:hypothetical protein